MSHTDSPDDLAEAFRSTVVRVRTAHDWIQCTPSTARLGGDLGEPVVHVLSAWYPPSGRPVDPLFQVRRHLELSDDLADRGVRFAPAVGFSPDLDYGEWSWATWGLTRDEAITIARDWLQLALFEIAEDELVLVSCDPSITTVSYPYRLDRFTSLPCAMGIPVTAGPNETMDLVPSPCAGAVAAADPANAQLDEVALWQQRYGLLGCGTCGPWRAASGC
jgi:hypothetical protein